MGPERPAVILADGGNEAFVEMSDAESTDAAINPLVAAAPAAAAPATGPDGQPLVSRLKGAKKRVVSKAARKKQDAEVCSRAT